MMTSGSFRKLIVKLVFQREAIERANVLENEKIFFGREFDINWSFAGYAIYLNNVREHEKFSSSPLLIIYDVDVEKYFYMRCTM